MTFKRPLPILPSPSRNTKTQTEADTNSLCRVCGDKASIINYGILSCASCKTFFRRNAFRPKNIRQCDLHGNCEITMQSRKVCTACRLAKCLAVGMNPEYIRKEDLSKTQHEQKQLVVVQPLSTLQPSTLEFLSTDQSSLSTSDWTLLSNIVHAFDTFNPVSKVRCIIEHINTQFGMEQSLQLMSSIYSSLESFVSSTPDFRIMTAAEQCSLIQRNMRGLWAFHSLFTFRESGIFDNTTNEEAILPLYGTINVQRTKRITTQLDHDLTLVKLMLITLTFSSNYCSIIEDENMYKDSLLYGTFRLLGSQNVYAELMWNYMIYRYGFSESVQRFAALIKIILDSLKLASDIYENNRTHHLLADEIMEQTERLLTISDQENASLWGKTL